MMIWISVDLTMALAADLSGSRRRSLPKTSKRLQSKNFVVVLMSVLLRIIFFLIRGLV